MPNPKSIKDFADCINNLRTNVNLASSGDISAYKIIAGQLRVLLCDSQNGKESPLLLKIFQSAKLHPLRNTMLSNDDDTKKWRESFSKGFNWDKMFIIPARIEFGRGAANVVELFDENMPPIGVKEWLDQPLFTNEITIREFIKSIADKEAVHSDNEYGKTLSTTSGVKIAGKSMHEIFIITIGKYILEKTTKAINNIRVRNQ